jgi:hypothetical protein
VPFEDPALGAGWEVTLDTGLAAGYAAGDGVTYALLIWPDSFQHDPLTAGGYHIKGTRLDWDTALLDTITLTATAGDEEILWEWTQADGDITGYELTWGEDEGGPYPNLVDLAVGDLGDAANPSYLSTSLTNGTTYYAVVRAYIDT